MTTITLTKDVEIEVDVDLSDLDDDDLITELRDRGIGFALADDLPIDRFIELVNLCQDAEAISLMYDACLAHAGRVSTRNLSPGAYRRLAS